MSLFYKNAIDSWVNFIQLMYQHNLVLNIRIFGNHSITMRRKPIFFPSFTQSKLSCLNDIWDPNHADYISDAELFIKLANKRNWISEWSIIKSAAKSILTKNTLNKTADGNTTINLSTLKFLSRGDKEIKYAELKLKDIQQIFTIQTKKLICESKWENTLSRGLPWNKIWNCLQKSQASLKAKQFHFKCLHQIVFCEHKLNLLGFSNGICTICGKERETLSHLLWKCEHAQSFWKNIVPILDTISVNTLNIDLPNPETVVLLGFFNNPVKCKIINTIVFETKWYIWKSRNSIKHENVHIDIRLSLLYIRKSVIDQFEHSKDKSLLNVLGKYFDL